MFIHIAIVIINISVIPFVVINKIAGHYRRQRFKGKDKGKDNKGKDKGKDNKGKDNKGKDSGDKGKDDDHDDPDDDDHDDPDDEEVPLSLWLLLTVLCMIMFIVR